MRARVTHAFTLLELLLVLGLLAVLMAFAWPNLSGATRVERLRESAQRMQTLVAMCRAEAMNEGRTYRIVFRPDGSVRVRCQLDPLEAPHVFVPVTTGWARTEVLLEDVWVAAVQLLPDGPAPIRIVDEQLEFPEMELDLQPIEDFAEPPVIEFQPNGSCDSLRLLLRDAQGAGRLLTLDGRLGRVTIEEYESAAAEDVQRPPPLPPEAEAEEARAYRLEDFQ